MWKVTRVWLADHARLITYTVGPVLVTVWTVLRHWTNGVNFDVVGQVGVADQWAHGLHDGAQLGATNYLLKMPMYTVVNHLGGLSPHLKLLVLALLFNITTFVLLVFLFEKLLRLYGVRPGAPFYLAMLWLASISGRVWWLDYANSRNLETAGGVLVLYLACRFLKLPGWRPAAWLITVGGVVFFADQLQIYSIAAGLVLYAALCVLRRRNREQLTVSTALVGSLAGAIIFDKILHSLATSLLPISFLTAPTIAPTGSLLHTLAGTLKGIAVSTARIFDASFYASGSAPNLARELLNMATLLAVVGVVVYYWRRSRSRSLAAICLCCIITTYGAYAASYQALQPITERYIIMVPILLMPLFGSLMGTVRLPRARRWYAVWAILLCLSGLLALGALTINFHSRYSKDAHLTDTLSFMQQHDFTLAVSSRDGIPETYFAQGVATVLPTICQPDHTLVESNLFFDRAAFTELSRHTGPVPLIVPGGAIVSSGSTCTVQDIENQLGQPLQEIAVPGVGVAEIYPSATLQRLHD